MPIRNSTSQTEAPVPGDKRNSFQEYPDWVARIPQAEVDFPGADGRLIGGEGGQVVLWTFADGGSVPEHRHGPQLGIVLSGCVQLTRGDETAEWTAGQTFSIDDQVPHAAVIAPGTRVVEIFQEHDRHRARQEQHGE
ncbi:cupin domain-containing protein [Streptomyces sp. NPDC047042]|uniref:cupin domain-containing protein n=1 Tax=Streptomyces sp. NPDC047042 TaxID=3154807 RepID=UPI0033D0FBCE